MSKWVVFFILIWEIQDLQKRVRVVIVVVGVAVVKVISFVFLLLLDSWKKNRNHEALLLHPFNETPHSKPKPAPAFTPKTLIPQSKTNGNPSRRWRISTSPPPPTPNPSPSNSTPTGTNPNPTSPTASISVLTKTRMKQQRWQWWCHVATLHSAGGHGVAEAEKWSGEAAGLKGNVVSRIGNDYLVLEHSRSGEKWRSRLVMLLNWVLRRKRGVWGNWRSWRLSARIKCEGCLIYLFFTLIDSGG